jgi:hypothetical protein
MQPTDLAKIFDRDLNKLKEEINLYRDEDRIWLTPAGISNCTGNLCLHLIGNLNHFIGATLGHTGYVRHRDDEFALKNILRQDILLNLDNTILIVAETLNKLTAEDLDKNFPLEKHGEIVTTRFMLLHLATHLSYHLGQINYHRRLLDRD